METRMMELVELMRMEQKEILEYEENLKIVQSKIDWMDCEHLEDNTTRWVGCAKKGGQCTGCRRSKFGATSWCEGCNFVTYKTKEDRPTRLEIGW